MYDFDLCLTLTYLNLALTFTGWASSLSFLVVRTVIATSSTIGLRIWAITVEIKKHKSIIEQKRMKKQMLNRIKILIS